MSRAARKGLTTPKRKVLKRSSIHEETWQVVLANDNLREKQTFLQLERLLKHCDLRKWAFTRRILIDSRATPHSHPVLTLKTKYLYRDSLMLSTFLHEQIHWFASSRLNRVKLAIAELEQVFPSPPVRPPFGAKEDSPLIFI
jgi:hypothetical protein